LCLPPGRHSLATGPHTLTSVAFVTPSYRLDRERCELLNRSLEACAPSFEHWIVVDRGDLPAFRRLQNNRTTVVAKEEILPLRVRRLDTLRVGLRSNVWLQALGRPIRGWLLQQFVKLAIAEQLTADVLVHADSDVVLLHRFTVDSVADECGRVRLYALPASVDATMPNHIRWHRAAERLLGIGPADLPATDFISSLVPWRRQNAVALLDRIEETSGRHWLRALAAASDVSEYTLYGRFAQDVLGASGAQFTSSSPLCADYYKRVPLTIPELTRFLDRVDEGTIAVSLTAKAGMKPQDYAVVLERRWETPEQPDAASGGNAGRSRRRPSGEPDRVAAGGSRRPSRHPARRETRVRARRSPARGIRDWAARSAMAAVMGLLFALMMVLLGFGID
jgi:hypothetical protein